MIYGTLLQWAAVILGPARYAFGAVPFRGSPRQVQRKIIGVSVGNEFDNFSFLFDNIQQVRPFSDSRSWYHE